MVEIINSELIRALRRATQIRDMDLPRTLATNIQAVVETNPKLLRECNTIKNGSCSNATSATIHTVDSSLDTYLLGGVLSYIKDATSTSTFADLEFTGEETGLQFIRIPCFTLTAGNGTQTFTIPNGVKLKKGSIVVCAASTNVANITVSATIFMSVPPNSQG